MPLGISTSRARSNERMSATVRRLRASRAIPIRRKPKSMQKILLPLCSALVLSTIVFGEANANSNGQSVISAKFNCGTASVDGDVVQGVYATSINIHNPQQSTTVQFNKTFVEAFEEGSGQSSKSSTTSDSLGPNQAEFVDCPVIYKALGVTPGTPIEGFVVIDIGNSSYGQEFLDVIGKYTARSSTGQVSALDLVVYTPSQVQN
jgi:hypothetical protein